jgi:hypothetical protein
MAAKYLTSEDAAVYPTQVGSNSNHGMNSSKFQHWAATGPNVLYPKVRRSSMFFLDTWSVDLFLVVPVRWIATKQSDSG